MPTVSYDRVTNGPISRITIYDNGVIDDQGPFWGNDLLRRYILQKTWTRTPGFFRALRTKTLRKRDLPMNPFSYYKKTINHPSSSLVIRSEEPFTSAPNFETYAGCVGHIAGLPEGPSFVELPPFDLDSLDDRASTGALLSLKDMKVNLAQAFAERGQTVRLMNNSIKRLSDAALALKRGRFAAAARSLGVKPSPRRIRKYTKAWHEDQSKALANGWLELQYGWRPLLSDIYGAAEQLAQTRISEYRNIVRKSASQTITSRGVRPPVSGGPAVYYDIMRKVTIKYVIYFSVPAGIHTLTKLGLTNPALIAWELTPWSFVIDWILPLGNYISSLDATSGLAFEKGCKTTFGEVTMFAKSATGESEPGKRWDTTVSCDIKEISVERQTLTSFPLPRLPVFKNPFTLTHTLNAIALLRTNLRVR